MTGAVLAVTGPPGSGKSTLGRALARALKLEYVSAGERFREEARRRGLSLEALSRVAEEDPALDRGLDDRMAALAGPGRLLDGRVQGALLKRRGVDVVVIEVTAREEVRARRLAERDRVSVEEARRATRAREASERRRYRAYYGLDLDREPADLTVDSSDLAPDQVLERVLAFLRTRPGGP